MNNGNGVLGLVCLFGLPVMCASSSVGCGASATEEAVGETTSAVVIGTTGHAFDYFTCAQEDGTCELGGPKYVAFGANGSFVYKATTGDVACTVASFGADPAYGVPKTCYAANYGFRLSEDSSGDRDNTQSREIAYGANGVFNFKTILPGTTYACNNATFGDPIPGVAKACYAPLPGYFRYAGEGTPAGSSYAVVPIAYGANGRFFYRIARAPTACDNATWGDPAPGFVKSCYTLTTSGFLADEGSSFTVGGTPSVQYGSGTNGNFLRTNTGSAPCSNTTFGGDPDFGVVKHCWNQ